jgi:alpha-glucosidase
MHVDEKTMDLSGMRTDGSKRDELIARVYVSTQTSRFTLFEDDGETVGFRKGAVAETEISQQLLAAKAAVVIAATKGGYGGAPERRANVVELVTPDNPATAVVLNGKPLAKLDCSQFEASKSGWCEAGKNLFFAKSEPLAVSEPKTFEFSLSR